MGQQQARQVPHEVCQQYQAQYQPSTCIYSTPTGRLEMKANTRIDNYGTLNMGFMSSGQQIRYQQQASSVMQNSEHYMLHSAIDVANNTADAQMNFGGHNVPLAPTSVQTVEPETSGEAVPEPAVAAPMLIDLTSDDETTTQSAVASQSPVSQPDKIIPAPSPKPDPKYWKSGTAHLLKELGNMGHSNAWFLFTSLQEIEPPSKRYRYAATHWPTEEAAFKDIMIMSVHFIDATEMLYYRMKWDAIESDLASGTLSSDIKEGLRAHLDNEKRRLTADLFDKRQNKVDLITKEQDAMWIERMSRPEFMKRFNMKHATKANKENVRGDLAAKLDRDRARERADRKSRMERTRGASLPEAAPTVGKAKKRTGGTWASKAKPSTAEPTTGRTRVSKYKPKTKAKSRKKVAAPVAAAVVEPLPTATLEAVRPFTPSPPPEPFSKPGATDLETIEVSSLSERTVDTVTLETVRPTIPPPSDELDVEEELAAGLEDSLVQDMEPEKEQEAQHEDEGYESIDEDEDEDKDKDDDEDEDDNNDSWMRACLENGRS